ncbi:hypothetical protein ACR2XN_29005, partial [Klebsiella pneumoniae]
IDQLQVILQDVTVSSSAKPSVPQLTPICLALFKIFHTNLLPRKSGRDRVTYQDTIDPVVRNLLPLS